MTPAISTQHSAEETSKDPERVLCDVGPVFTSAANEMLIF